ncbi:MAG: polyribonucleotide nucleotidyltransferase [Tissierellia bacterium]|nr:polyribonucleotide nucleotidyltransferase [Tissierellia bacterium]
MEEKIYKHNLAGKEIEIRTGKYAEQANGSCIVKYGDTMILATATASKNPREGIDFFPLSVDYEEKYYAAGKIPGGFVKREGRPSEKAILTSRLIDRPIRPLFPEGYRNDVQVVTTVLSVDPNYSPEISAMIGSSVALSISDIPFNGPTGSVSVGYIDGKYVINPNEDEKKLSEIDLTVAGTKTAIMMIEAGAKIVSEEVMLGAILAGHEEIKKLCTFIEGIVSEIGKDKAEYEAFTIKEEIYDKMEAKYKNDLVEAFMKEDKLERQDAIDALKDRMITENEEEYPDDLKDIAATFEKMLEHELRKTVIYENKRPDNRKLDEIRPIWTEVGILPRAHGSGVFTRGQTQVMTVATLGTISDAQTIDGLTTEMEKGYMHQYNFPPYSVGDVRPLRGPGRREIGHGALAEKALVPVLPSEEDFPYTIRLVSEVLSSNGSSSMASVCGSTLSLLDAGVPIKAPVAGIAMGLMKLDDKVAILTDIQGLEDHLGDMDFKVAGTKEGITALQMDIKVEGIEEEILRDALEQAKVARLFILGKINSTISASRENLSKYAPRMTSMEVDPDKVREIIGPGGKMINKIIDETGAKIDIVESTVFISTPEEEGLNKAIDMINAIIKDVEVGDVYDGKVSRIMKFGAFIEFGNNKEGLCHISQLDKKRVEKVEDVVNIGDEVRVKVIEIDDKGRINLSRKVLL